MKALEWLLRGDPAVARLTRKYLLDEAPRYDGSGLVAHRLSLFDPRTHLWGGGLYSPKWVSTTYTLLELIGLEADGREPAIREGAKAVLNGVWRGAAGTRGKRETDMCVAGMLLRIACYARLNTPVVGEIVCYALAHQTADGGWNCEWDARPRPSRVGSVHTTLTMLEGFLEYERQGYAGRLDEINSAASRGREFLLARELYKDKKTGLPLHPDMVSLHYSCRWKYDCFRALEYFADAGCPFDPRMEGALELTRDALKKGYAPKGKAYSGRTHGPVETGRGGRFNTLRALKILKAYDRDAYGKIVNADYAYPD